MNESIRDELDLSYEAVKDQIARLVSALPPSERVFRVRCAALVSDRESEPEIVLCRIDLGGRLGIQKEVRRYRELLLLRETVDEAGFVVCLDNLAVGRVDVGGQSACLRAPGSYWRQRYLRSESEWSHQPGELFSLESTRRPNISFHRPLVSYAHEYYPSPLAAISTWVDLPSVGVRGYTDVGVVRLFVAQRRAYFRSVERHDDDLKFGIDGTAITGLAVRGAWLGPGEQFAPFHAPVKDRVTVLQIPERWTGLDSFLVDAQDEVLDCHRQGRYAASGHAPIPLNVGGFGSGTAVIESAIARGEGEALEFKSFIDLSSQKAHDIVKTVIAFANSGGGRLLIGVEDDCSVSGIDRGVRKSRETGERDLDQAAERYRGSVLARVKDAVVPEIEIDVRVVSYRGLKVLVLDVPAGQGTPYSVLQSKRIYVRRGSSSALADPRTDIPRLCRQEFGHGLFRPGTGLG